MRHLHVVPPPGEAPATPVRRRRGPAPALFLSDDEVRALRAATRGIARTRFGSLRALASALGVAPNALTRKTRPSPALAVALWRLTGIPLETLLRPTLAAVPSPAPEGGAS